MRSVMSNATTEDRNATDQATAQAEEGYTAQAQPTQVASDGQMEQGAAIAESQESVCVGVKSEGAIPRGAAAQDSAKPNTVLPYDEVLNNVLCDDSFLGNITGNRFFEKKPLVPPPPFGISNNEQAAAASHRIRATKRSIPTAVAENST